MVQFVAGFETAIAWVWYVMGVVAAIGVGVVIAMAVIAVLSVGFDVASERVAALWKQLREGRHGKE